MSPATFTGTPYELTVPGNALVVTLLAAEDGARLGTAFAGIDPWAAYGYPPATLANFLATPEPGAPRLALHLDGVLAGAAVVRSGWLRGPYLQFLAVLPAFQGRGIGGSFVNFMEREARAAQERNLWVAASEINDGATRLYERLGFTRITRLDDLACDGRAEILFRKRLT